MRSIADCLKEYPENSSKLLDYFFDQAICGPRNAYDTPMQSIQSAICKALPSLKNLICDASVMGGIKMPDKSLTSFMQDLYVWGFYHPKEVSTCLKIANYLREKPTVVSRLITELSEIDFKPKTIQTIDVNLFSCDAGVTKRLSGQKNKVLELLPVHLKEQLGDPAKLDDFHYAVLLCAVLSALRDRMCKQTYKLSMNILPFA